MRGSTKKQAVLVIITVMALFIMVDMASAGPPAHHAIRGEYAATGGGVVLVAPLGFNLNNLTPVNGIGIIQMTSREGDFTFNPDGTGSAESRERTVILPQLPPGSPLFLGAGSWVDSFDFKYTVTDDGKITITPIPGTFTSTWTTGQSSGTHYIEGASFKGTITPDRKIITLDGGAPEVRTLTPPLVPGFTLQTIYNSHWILIWQH